MRRTIEFDGWQGGQLVNEASGDNDDCTISELIEFLQQRQREAEEAGLENIRLGFSPGDYFGEDDSVCLLGDREETKDERNQREEAAQRQERRVLLDVLAERHHPQVRNENKESWKMTCAVLIQQRGWDKLVLEELRALVGQTE